jgi:predicted nucleotide-binding protein (sugar kinase/HSP70/actin superfamily)
MEKNEQEQALSEIRKKLYVNVDQNHLIRQITDLSNQIAKLKKQKEHNEQLKKLLNYISDAYKESFGSYELNFVIPKIKKEIDSTSNDTLKQIIYKSDKLEEMTLLLDFLNYDSFEKVMEVRK